MHPRRAYPAPVLRPVHGLCLVVPLACGDNPAFDPPSPTSEPVGASTTSPPIDPTTSPVDPSTDTSTATTRPVDPTTTTAVDASTSTSTDSTSTSSETTGGPEPMPEPTQPEKLQFYKPENCKTPLWCHHPNDPPAQGTPQRTAAQLCFRPTSAPPYLLDRIGWVVAATLGDLNQGTFLEVYTGTENGPDQLLYQRPLGANAVDPIQPHATVFNDDPIVIPTPIFCVGLVGGYSDGAGAGLGIAVDETVIVSDSSFLAWNSGGPCDEPGWLDVADYEPNPTGTWCLDADIRGF